MVIIIYIILANKYFVKMKQFDTTTTTRKETGKFVTLSSCHFAVDNYCGILNPVQDCM